MGLQQLEKLPMLDAARRENWAKLRAIFEPYAQYFHMPEATEKSDPCWFAFLLTIKEGAPFSRPDIVNHLEGLKIQTRSYFSGNILAHPGYVHLAEEYGDMFKYGVIDPAKVARTALEDAASIAGLLITTEAMIADKPEPKGGAAAPAMPDMGGMGGMGGMM